MKKYFYSVLIGFFFGFLVTYNYLLNDLDYRISFYGYYLEKNGKSYPIIKLRKKIKSFTLQQFDRWDEGQDLEIADLVVTGRIDFDDNKANEFIKQRYCK